MPSTVGKKQKGKVYYRSLNDRVMIGGRAKPQYLRGEIGTVHELDDDYVVVLLERVFSKFTSRQLRCAPEMVGPLRDS